MNFPEDLSNTVNIHEAIIERCRQKDRGAQYELYELYHKAMYNTALRICGEIEDAEDVLQESFVAAFERLDQYRGDATFGAWLKRIVINKSLNAVKKKTNVEETDITDYPEDSFYEWEEVPDRELSVEKVKMAIAQLPIGFRTVMNLYLFEGYDHKEIAQILGITESTSKSQFNRAKRKVRELISKEVKYG